MYESRRDGRSSVLASLRDLTRGIVIGSGVLQPRLRSAGPPDLNLPQSVRRQDQPSPLGRATLGPGAQATVRARSFGLALTLLNQAYKPEIKVIGTPLRAPKGQPICNKNKQFLLFNEKLKSRESNWPHACFKGGCPLQSIQVGLQQSVFGISVQ